MRSISVFVVCLAVVLALQLWSGAYGIEIGTYSDDAAHFMNGMVIREYVTTALGHDPMAFAENYYLSYPKIAPLMWPPLFHVALGLFLLPGWPPGIAALLLVALTSAWLAWRLYEITFALSGPVAAFACTGLLLTTSFVVSLSGVVMLDVAIAAFGLEAVYWLARHTQSESRRHAILFGIFTAGACLTKGNGVAVVLAPPVFMILTGRYDLLRKSGLYLAGVIVVVLAVPLLYVSTRLDAAIGDFGPVTAEVMAGRVNYYSAYLLRHLGPLVLALAFGGAWLSARRKWIGADPETRLLAPALTSLAVATLAFHLLTPHIISVSRYLTAAVAPIACLAFLAAWTIADRIGTPARRRSVYAVVAITMVVATVAARPWPRRVLPMGYRAVVERLAATNDLAGRRLLVVSDEFGEGAFVSEVAIVNPHPAPTVVRGSKLISSENWMGQGFRLNYGSSLELLADLEALHIAYVVLDRSDGARLLPYFNQVQALADGERARFALVAMYEADAVSGPLRSLAVYRVTSPVPGPPRPIQIALPHSIGRSIGR